MDGLTGASEIAGLTYLLSGLTKPVIEELGGVVGDRVAAWRAGNLKKILEASNGMLSSMPSGKVILNPKLVLKIASAGSYESDPDLQKMWAGLLVTSVNDSNVPFVHLLEGLTAGQAKILKHSAQLVDVYYDSHDLIGLQRYSRVQVGVEELFALTGYNAISRLDQELDYLREQGLVGEPGRPDNGGFAFDTPGDPEITPTPLALNLIARASGEIDSVVFFHAKPVGGIMVEQRSPIRGA